MEGEANQDVGQGGPTEAAVPPIFGTTDGPHKKSYTNPLQTPNEFFETNQSVPIQNTMVSIP